MLSLLFGRLPAHPALVKRQTGTEVVSNRSLLLTGPHSSTAFATLNALNGRTRDLFISHLREFIASTPEDDAVSPFKLPLTKAALAKGAPSTPPASSSGGVLSYLSSCSRNVKLRSPFVALRGFGDSFTTVNELARDVRGDVFVCTSQVCAGCEVFARVVCMCDARCGCVVECVALVTGM